MIWFFRPLEEAPFVAFVVVIGISSTRWKKLIQKEHDARKNSEKFKGNQYVTSGGGKNLHDQNENTKANKIRAEIAEEH